MLSDAQFVHILDILAERCPGEVRDLGWGKTHHGWAWIYDDPHGGSAMCVAHEAAHFNRMALLAVAEDLLMRAGVSISYDNYLYKCGALSVCCRECTPPKELSLDQSRHTAAYLALCKMKGREVG